MPNPMLVRVIEDLTRIVKFHVPPGWAFVLAVAHPDHGHSVASNLTTQETMADLLDEIGEGIREGQGEHHYIEPDDG